MSSQLRTRLRSALTQQATQRTTSRITSNIATTRRLLSTKTRSQNRQVTTPLTFQSIVRVSPPLSVVLFAAFPVRGPVLPKFGSGDHGGSSKEDQFDVSAFRKAYDDLEAEKEQSDRNLAEILTGVQSKAAKEGGDALLTPQDLQDIDFDDPSTWPDALRTQLESLTDTYERLRSDPATVAWCRDYIKDIYRFCNDTSAKETYNLRLGTDEFKNMIRYKTFIEKERFKLFLQRDGVLDMQRQLAVNIDQILSALTETNPPDPVTGDRYVSQPMRPVYKSLVSSMGNALEVMTLYSSFFDMMHQIDRDVAKLMQKNNQSDAFSIIRAQANMVAQLVVASENIAKYIDQTLNRFESYYTSTNVERLLQYADIERSKTHRKSIEHIILPTPPLFDLSPEAMFEIAGITGDIPDDQRFEPTSLPFSPIIHLTPRERIERLTFPDQADDDHISAAESRRRAVHAQRELYKIQQRHPNLSDATLDDWFEQRRKVDVYHVGRHGELPDYAADDEYHNPMKQLEDYYNSTKQPGDPEFPRNANFDASELHELAAQMRKAIDE